MVERGKGERKNFENGAICTVIPGRRGEYHADLNWMVNRKTKTSILMKSRTRSPMENVVL